MKNELSDVFAVKSQKLLVVVGSCGIQIESGGKELP